MRLDGLHHVTAITGDAPRNVDFYARALGLRLVKRTVNYDAPDVYHLYYGDESGAPGSILTFFEFPGAAPGRAGAGMIHRVVLRVGGTPALDWWEARLGDEGVPSERTEGALRLSDPEGLGLELRAVASAEPPLAAAAPGVPPEHAIRGLHEVRAFARSPERSLPLLTAQLGMAATAPGEFLLSGPTRSAGWAYDAPPEARAVQGAGTVHHVAWAAEDADHPAWRTRLAAAGLRTSPVMDRTYFRSIYFREPSGVLFELATRGPGFAVDEPAAELGSTLALPAEYEPFRARLVERLTPIEAPRRQPARLS